MTFLLLEIVRLTSILLSMCSISRLSKYALSRLLLKSKRPVMVAFSSPLRIISEFALSPKRREMESIIKLLPAPVSPVKTVNPLLKEILTSSIIAKFLTDKFISIKIYYPNLDKLNRKIRNLNRSCERLDTLRCR